MIKYRIVAAMAFAVASSFNFSGAIAADTHANTAAAQSFQKLSQQGSLAFQEIGLARIAIFNGNPNVAAQMIKRAQAALTKAQTDGTSFTKAEGELKASPQHPNPTATGDTKAVMWLPIGGDLSINNDYSANPSKAEAVAKANEHLKKGERDRAIETLRLADVNLSFTLAVVPVKTAVADVDEAATLLTQGKYYEANLSLKRVQDSVRYDWLDLNAMPIKKDMPTMHHDLKKSAPATHSTENQSNGK